MNHSELITEQNDYISWSKEVTRRGTQYGSEILTQNYSVFNVLLAACFHSGFFAWHSLWL
jgi:hypothetical protein